MLLVAGKRQVDVYICRDRATMEEERCAMANIWFDPYTFSFISLLRSLFKWALIDLKFGIQLFIDVLYAIMVSVWADLALKILEFNFKIHRKVIEVRTLISLLISKGYYFTSFPTISEVCRHWSCVRSPSVDYLVNI